MAKELMPQAELLEYLQISRTTLHKLTRSRQIPFIRPGRRVLFRKSDIDCFLESKLVK